MGVLADINAVYLELYEQEKKVADYIFKNSEDIIEMSVMELAQKSDVSDATVMRFCKKVGFKGFYHFKISLAKDLAVVDNQLSSNIDMNDMEKSIHNIFIQKIEELKRCDALMDYQTVTTCLKKISSCELLYIFGAGNTNPIAIYAAYQFNQCGVKTVVNIAPEMQINSAFCLSSKDTAIIISNSGTTKMVVDVAEIAKAKGATIIAITSHPRSNLGIIADHVLTSSFSDKILFDAYNSTRMSHLAIVDLLLILFSRQKSKSYYQISSEREEFLSKFKL